MATAPAPYLNACTETLYKAMIMCRMWANEKSVTHDQLADLLDAIHNLPKAIRSWEKQDPDYLRGKIQDYDDTWKGKGGLVLGEIWDGAIEGQVELN